MEKSSWKFHLHDFGFNMLPSRQLTYPTWEKGKASKKRPLKGDMLVPRRVIFRVCKLGPLTWKPNLKSLSFDHFATISFASLLCNIHLGKLQKRIPRPEFFPDSPENSPFRKKKYIVSTPPYFFRGVHSLFAHVFLQILWGIPPLQSPRQKNGS